MNIQQQRELRNQHRRHEIAYFRWKQAMLCHHYGIDIEVPRFTARVARLKALTKQQWIDLAKQYQAKKH